MAPKKKPYQAKRGSQSPNTVLVIFLIFFILATILLGVACYYGYSGQAKLKEVAEQKEKAEKAARAAEQWALAQARLVRTALGDGLLKEEKLDEENLLNQFLGEREKETKKRGDGFLLDDNTVNPNSKFKDMPEFEKLKEMFTANVKVLGWDAAKDRFAKNYRAVVADLEAKLAAAEALAAKEQRENAETKKLYGELQASREKFFAEARDLIKKGNDKALAAALERTEAMSNLLKENEVQRKQHEEAKAALEAKLNEKNRENFELRTQLKARGVGTGQEKGAPAPKAAAAHALMLDISPAKPLWDTPVGKVLRVEPDGRRAYINLGRTAGVKPQMTFNVFAAGPNGKADGLLKATVEVQDVIDANTSLVRATSLYDLDGKPVSVADATTRLTIQRRGENPLREGDLLFNSLWGAHVVVAGDPDMGGESSGAADQLRQIRAFIAFLERQGAVVDGFLDPTDGQLKGEFTPKTNYLVRGEAAPAPKGSKVDPAEALKAVQTEAVERGVFVLSPANLRLITGHRPPRAADDREVFDFTPRPTRAEGGS